MTILRRAVPAALSVALAAAGLASTAPAASAAIPPLPVYASQICRKPDLGSTVLPDRQVPRAERYTQERGIQVEMVHCWYQKTTGKRLSRNWFDRDVEAAIESFNVQHGVGRTSTVTPKTWEALTAGIDWRRYEITRLAQNGGASPGPLTPDGAEYVQDLYQLQGISIPGTIDEIVARGTEIPASQSTYGDVVVARIPAGDYRRTDPDIPLPERVVGIVFNPGGARTYFGVWQYHPDDLAAGYGVKPSYAWGGTSAGQDSEYKYYRMPG